MLDQNDKQWISDEIRQNTQDICQAMAEGFSRSVSIDQRLQYLENNMVSKEYLDQRLDNVKERISEPLLASA